MTKRYSLPSALILAGLLWVWSSAVSQTAELPAYQIVEDNAGEIRQFVMQIAGGELERLLPTIHDFVTQVGSNAEGYFACSEASEAQWLLGHLRAWGVEKPERFQTLNLPQVSTIWARDRFVAALRRSGEQVLFFPPLRADVGTDFWVPEVLARWIPGLALLPSAFYVEGGDLVAGHDRLFVGATTVRFAIEAFPSCTEWRLRELLEGHFGKRVVFLPDFGKQDDESTDLDYHLDMFLTVCHDDSVLLADLQWGNDLVTAMAEEEVAEQAFDEEDLKAIREDFEVNRRRLEAVHHSLIRDGVRVRRVPLYWIPGEDYGITYNNVLQEETPEGPVVYLPRYGVDDLDRTAAGVYANLGYEVRPVDVSEIFELQGTLRCVVNVIRRGPIWEGEDAQGRVERGQQGKRQSGDTPAATARGFSPEAVPFSVISDSMRRRGRPVLTNVLEISGGDPVVP